MAAQIWYHADCYDGITSAWLAHEALSKTTDRITHVAMRYGDPVPPFKPGEMIVIVDFSFKREVFLNLLDMNGSNVLLLDHHITAAKDLEGVPQTVIDINRCGAQLVRDWFKLGDKRIVDYIADHDLNRFELPQTKFIIDYLSSVPKRVECWGDAVKHIEEEPAAVLRIGRFVGRAKSQQILTVVRKHSTVLAPIAYANSSMHQSDLAKALIDFWHVDAAVVWWESEDGEIRASLRSRESVDISLFAERWGGGGHKNAAGVRIKGFHPIDFIRAFQNYVASR